MKFYKAKNAKVGQEVEATILYHKDNGDELICVHKDSESFEKQNPKAKECSKENADKLLTKTKVKLAIPKKKVRRKKGKHLKDEEILKEIENKKTPTVNIIKSHDEEDQTLTYVEEVEIASTDEFFEAQKAQNNEPEIEDFEEIPKEEPPKAIT